MPPAGRLRRRPRSEPFRALWQSCHGARGIFGNVRKKLKYTATSRPLYLRHIPPPCRQELEHAAAAGPHFERLERRWRSVVILSGFYGVVRTVAVAAVVAFGTVVANPALAREAPQSFADLVDKLLPTVVNITTTQNVPQQGPKLRDMPQL